MCLDVNNDNKRSLNIKVALLYLFWRLVTDMINSYLAYTVD